MPMMQDARSVRKRMESGFIRNIGKCKTPPEAKHGMDSCVEKINRRYDTVI